MFPFLQRLNSTPSVKGLSHTCSTLHDRFSHNVLSSFSQLEKLSLRAFPFSNRSKILIICKICAKTIKNASTG